LLLDSLDDRAKLVSAMNLTFILVLLVASLAAPRAHAATPVYESVLSSNLHRLIVTKNQGAGTQLQPYAVTFPWTNVTFRMVPIPAGEFLLGSPTNEPGRRADEGPQRRVRLKAFWMGACEVSWDEYQEFTEQVVARSRTPREKATHPASFTNKLADAVSVPSRPYIEETMGMGRIGFPAINMTQHAANKYCQWLSAVTGEFYRLPTEAEWEYACRAGTTTRYSFGNDEKNLEKFAWFEQNSDSKYHRVGRKLPNPWGLFDMHGNVAEWTLDGYDPHAYEMLSDGVLGPYLRGWRPYPHVVRGGSWRDDAAHLRSADRQFSVPKWKDADPDLPKSVWHLVEADFVGFRIVRPLEIPSAYEMHNAWNNGVEVE
jgi:formylglycine-generating enzyme required for sulfatase activity